MTQVPKRRLSLFSFGSNSSQAINTNDSSVLSGPKDGRIITAAGGDSLNMKIPNTSSAFTSAAAEKPAKESRLSVNTNGNGFTSNGSSFSNPVTPNPMSPNAQSPVSNDGELNIFERSVQDNCSTPFEPPMNLRRPTLTRLRSKQGHGSSISLSNFKNEDYIPPALDATASILSDNNTNLDDIDIIYSLRRNSSVIGLNMALGRGTPSRKNSVYSMSQLHQQSSPSIQNQSNSMAIPELSNNESQGNPLSPTSPPKLSSSKSSISFYSYADMLNNDEYAKRPSFKLSYSQGIIPTRKNSLNSSKFSNQNGKKFGSNLNKFLISPESSDSEDDVVSRNKSINDNESLVSSSIGDCLRQTNTELSGST